MKFDVLIEQILQQQKNNLVVIFPGRFQPFHVGHKKLYDAAKQKFPGADFYVATADATQSNVKEPDRYPFNFAEKKQIIQATGIPENEIALTPQPYRPIEVLKKYDQNVAKVVYIVGEKDMRENARFSFKPKKDGSASYFQPFKSLNELEPFKEQGGHGYIYAPGTVQFNVGGKSITSATELRNMYKTADEATRKQYIKDTLGKYDQGIYNLFNTKLS